MNTDVTLKHFDQPDEVGHFEKGTFEVVTVGGMTVGRATYQPGWRWSEHVGPLSGTASCQVEHVGVVLQGKVGVKMDDETAYVLQAGDVFYVPPGHDSWIIGDAPYQSLHLMGAADYAH